MGWRRQRRRARPACLSRAPGARRAPRWSIGRSLFPPGGARRSAPKAPNSFCLACSSRAQGARDRAPKAPGRAEGAARPTNGAEGAPPPPKGIFWGPNWPWAGRRDPMDPIRPGRRDPMDPIRPAVFLSAPKAPSWSNWMSAVFC